MLIVCVHIYEVVKWGPEHASREEQGAKRGRQTKNERLARTNGRTYIVISKRLRHGEQVIGDANEKKRERLRLMDKRDSRGFLLILELIETQVRGQPMLGQKFLSRPKEILFSFSREPLVRRLSHIRNAKLIRALIRSLDVR